MSCLEHCVMMLMKELQMMLMNELQMMMETVDYHHFSSAKQQVFNDTD